MLIITRQLLPLSASKDKVSSNFHQHKANGQLVLSTRDKIGKKQTDYTLRFLLMMAAVHCMRGGIKRSPLYIKYKAKQSALEILTEEYFTIAWSRLHRFHRVQCRGGIQPLIYRHSIGSTCLFFTSICVFVFVFVLE